MSDLQHSLRLSCLLLLPMPFIFLNHSPNIYCMSNSIIDWPLLLGRSKLTLECSQEQLLSWIQEGRGQKKVDCSTIVIRESLDLTESSGPGMALWSCLTLRQEWQTFRLIIPELLDKNYCRVGHNLGLLSFHWLREIPRERLSCEPLAADTPGTGGVKCFWIIWGAYNYHFKEEMEDCCYD